MNLRHRAAALGLALTLTLGFAGVASAASVSESVTVINTASLSLSTASINYGNLAPGATSATFPVTATISGLNGPTGGWTMTIAGTDLTSGALTIPKSYRFVTGGQSIQGGAGSWTDSGSGTQLTPLYQFSLQVPAGQTSGTYTGSTTFTLTGN